MKWVIPFKRVVDDFHNWSVPYDGEDPYIFHSLTTVSYMDQLESLVKENALISSKKMIREEAQAARAWDAAYIPRGGEVTSTDADAGDDRYVFMTPGYQYSYANPTLAFRYSTIRALTSLRFRFLDLIDVYDSITLREDEFSRAGYGRELHRLAQLATLTPDQSSWFIPEFIHASVAQLGNYSDEAVNLAYGLQRTYEVGTGEERQIAAGIGQVMRRVKANSEALSDQPIPVRAAEMYYDHTQNRWFPMSTLTGMKINGLSAALMPKRRRVMIPGWKVR